MDYSITTASTLPKAVTCEVRLPGPHLGSPTLTRATGQRAAPQSCMTKMASICSGLFSSKTVLTCWTFFGFPAAASANWRAATGGKRRRLKPLRLRVWGESGGASDRQQWPLLRWPHWTSCRSADYTAILSAGDQPEVKYTHQCLLAFSLSLQTYLAEKEKGMKRPAPALFLTTTQEIKGKDEEREEVKKTVSFPFKVIPRSQQVN